MDQDIEDMDMDMDQVVVLFFNGLNLLLNKNIIDNNKLQKIQCYYQVMNEYIQSFMWII